MSHKKIDLANFGTSSDESLIEAARRVIAKRPEGQKENNSERELRLRPTGDSAGRVLYDFLREQSRSGVPVQELGI